MKADQVLDIIQNQMEVEEKWKLLDELYHLHYDTRVNRRAEFETN
ncbi:pentatricopeptide repeat-containing protein At2g35130-like [Oceanobacillus picturae]|uniref:Pentatricopeptide repeat-containing protein At2g35130-like n=1 Tax=Oceanobacillus picturae TaxID=171693 RepID=A0A0U9H7R1_9BACI|nr:hypothetical protein [Oceanobacillus picturae]GAQ18698.1 pentatricopeptide repeat-containing protein At2g35130-like [Oceanobacillus picturae]